MWVVALARLEAGAILGTFTTLPAPFEIIGPSQYEMPAYKELLMDGAQTHYWALVNDASVKAVAANPPGTEMLAYIRRLNLARAMLSAAARSNAKDLSSTQWSQLVEEDQQLLNLRNSYSQQIDRYLALMRSTNVNKSIPDSAVRSVKACGLQLEGERQELQAGTASFQIITAKKDRVNR